MKHSSLLAAILAYGGFYFTRCENASSSLHTSDITVNCSNSIITRVYNGKLMGLHPAPNVTRVEFLVNDCFRTLDLFVARLTIGAEGSANLQPQGGDNQDDILPVKNDLPCGLTNAPSTPFVRSEYFFFGQWPSMADFHSLLVKRFGAEFASDTLARKLWYVHVNLNESQSFFADASNEDRTCFMTSAIPPPQKPVSGKGPTISSGIVNQDESQDSKTNMNDNNNNMLTNFSRTSVLFVSISFIILMVISLAWLLFYYIQRFRYAHAKDRLARRLFNAARKVLSKMETRRASEKELRNYSDCPVCIEHYRLNDLIRILPCRHVFHKSCVDVWLLEHRSCPMCKLDILKAFGYQFCHSEENVHHIEGDQLSHGTSTDGRMPLSAESDVHDPFFPSPAPSLSRVQTVLHQSSAQGYTIIPLTVHSSSLCGRGSDSSESSSGCNVESASAQVHNRSFSKYRRRACTPNTVVSSPSSSSSQSPDKYLFNSCDNWTGRYSESAVRNSRASTASTFTRTTHAKSATAGRLLNCDTLDISGTDNPHCFAYGSASKQTPSIMSSTKRSYSFPTGNASSYSAANKSDSYGRQML